MSKRISSVKEIDFTPYKPVFPSPADWRDQVIYELMIDRFDDNQEHPAFDPNAKRSGHDQKEGARFQGGNLKGIIKRLDYIQCLGATAVWMTPPLKNRPVDEGSYHGYAPQDFLAVDPRFGTLEDFQEIVNQAHKRGMYVLLDVVIDHSGDVWGYENNEDKTFNGGERHNFGFWRNRDGGTLQGEPGPDDALWPIELQQADAFKRMGRMNVVGNAHGDEATDGDFMSLKKLDLSNPTVIDAVIKIYKYWIAQTDVDGFRIDAFRHVRPDPASDFVHAIREYATSIGKKNFIQIGEVSASNEEMLKYVGLNTPLAGEGEKAHYPRLDACLDFSLYGILPGICKGERNPQELDSRLVFLRRYYRDFSEAGKNYVTFIENHDGGADGRNHRLLHWDHDDRLAILAATALLTTVGIPCLYQGQEQGFDGGGDGDIHHRECMFGGKWGAFDTTGVEFFNTEHPIYKAIANVCRVRAQHPVLRYGRQYVRSISGDGEHFGMPIDGKATLGYSRVLSYTEMIIVMNLDRDDRNDWIEVDKYLTPSGTKLVDLLAPGEPLTVEMNGEFASVRVALKGRQVKIFAHAGVMPED